MTGQLAYRLRPNPETSLVGTQAAFEAITETLPFGSARYEAKPSADGGRFVWLERFALSKLDALRHPCEGYSEIIIRLAEIEASRPGRKRAKPSR